MTGWGSIDTAVEAMRRGAKSFVQKPWEDVTLLEILEREIAEARADAPPRSQAAARVRGGAADPARPAADDDTAGRRHRPLGHLAAGRRRRRRLLRHARLRQRARRLDRRHRRQRAAGRAADVEPAGRGPRLRAGSGLARIDQQQRQPAAVPQHGERPLRDVLLRAHRTGGAPDRLLERRPQSAAADPPRRRGREARRRRHGPRRLPRQPVRAGGAAARPPATGCCSTPTASPRRATPKGTSTARTASPPPHPPSAPSRPRRSRTPSSPTSTPSPAASSKTTRR